MSKFGDAAKKGLAKATADKEACRAAYQAVFDLLTQVSSEASATLQKWLVFRIHPPVVDQLLSRGGQIDVIAHPDAAVEKPLAQVTFETAGWPITLRWEDRVVRVHNAKAFEATLVDLLSSPHGGRCIAAAIDAAARLPPHWG